MSIMHFDAMTAASAGGFDLALPALAYSFGGPQYSYGYSEAGFRFANDTYIYRDNLTGQLQIGGDYWITPRTGVTTADYEIRWHTVSILSSGGVSTPIFVGSTGWDEDEWVNLTASKTLKYGVSLQTYNNELQQESIVKEEGFWTGTFRIELRVGDGSDTGANPLTTTIAPFTDRIAAFSDNFQITLGLPL